VWLKNTLFDRWLVIPVTIILQPAMQNQLRVLILFVGDTLRLKESPPFIGFLIGALVVEVFADPWWWTRRLTKHPIFDFRNIARTTDFVWRKSFQ